MAIEWQCADKLAAITLAGVGVAIGDPGTIVGGAVATAGLIGAWRLAKAKFGLESERYLARTREHILSDCEKWARSEGMSDADLKAADFSLDRHLADCIPSLAKLAELARDRTLYPKAAAEYVVAELALRDGLFREGAPQFSLHAHGFAMLVVERALADAMREEGYAAPLRTAMMVEMLSGLREVQDVVESGIQESKVQHAALSAQISSGNEEMLAKIMARFDSYPTRPDISQEAVLAIARRVNPLVYELDDAVAQIQAAIDEFILIREQAARGSNLGHLVDQALRRIAERNVLNDFDGAAKSGEEAYVELLGRQTAERIALAEAMIGQSRVRVNAEELARWEEERLRIEATVLSAGALFTVIERYRRPAHYSQEISLDETRLLLLDLRVAIILAWRSLAIAKSAGEEGEAHNWIGLTTYDFAERSFFKAKNNRLEKAIEAFRKALEVRTKSEFPIEWAETQVNLGTALKALGMRFSGSDGTALLKQSADAFQAALEVHRKVELPVLWAVTQNKFADTLTALGECIGGSAGTALLEEAVIAYREALEVRTKSGFPIEWAATQTNLGTALKALGMRVSGSDGTTWLKQSVDAFRAALEVNRMNKNPILWFELQNMLGTTLTAMGERIGGSAGALLVEEAISIFKAALEPIGPAWSSFWVKANKNLGLAFEVMADMVSGDLRAAHLSSSEAAFLLALELPQPDESPDHHQICTASLSRIRTKLAECEGR